MQFLCVSIISVSCTHRSDGIRGIEEITDLACLGNMTSKSGESDR